MKSYYKPNSLRFSTFLFPLLTVTFVLDRLRLHPGFPLSVQRVFYIIILFLMCILLLSKHHIRTLCLTPTVMLIFVFNIALFLSLAFASHSSLSILVALALLQLSLAGLLVGLFLVNFWNIQHMNILSKTLSWVALGSAITVITDYFGLTSFQNLYLHEEIGREFGILGEPNFAAGKMALCLPFIIWSFLKALSDHKSLQAVLYTGCCGIIIIAIILTGSRMGILMVAICILLAGFREWKLMMQPVSILIGGFFAVIIIILVITYFRSMLVQVLQRFEVLWVFLRTGVEIRGLSITRRVEMLRAGWDIFKDHPLFGVGIGGYRFILPYYRPVLGIRYAHNTFIEMLTGTGLFGFIPFISLLLCIVKQFLKRWRFRESGHVFFYYTLSFMLLCIFLFFLSDTPNRYLWGLFVPLTIYLEWLNSNFLASKKNASIDSSDYME